MDEHAGSKFGERQQAIVSAATIAPALALILLGTCASAQAGNEPAARPAAAKPAAVAKSAAVAKPAAVATKPGAPAPAAAPAAKPPATVQARVLLVPPREAKLSSQMAGRVIRMPVPEGASFGVGAVLVEFDCEHQQAQLAISNAGVAKTRAQLSSKTELQKHAAVGDLDVKLAAVDLDDAVARQKQAQAMVRDCRVNAPYAGRVVRRIVNQYEQVGAGAPLIEIQEGGRLKLEALLPSHVAAWVRTGTTFKVHVDEVNKDVTAVVTGVGSRIDSVSQTLRITAEIRDKAPELLAGMSGNATLTKP